MNALLATARLGAAPGASRWRVFGLILATLLACAPVSAAEVLLLLSASSGPYAEAAQGFRAELARASPGARLTTAELADGPDLSKFTAIAAIGSAASQFLGAAPGAPPAVHALIPSATYLALPAAPQGTRSAVFIDQPIERQLALLRAALPDWPRLALIHGDATRTLAAQLTRAAEQRGMRVSVAPVADRSELYGAIQMVLSEPAILLALPDPEVFNSYTVQNILLSAYREKSPVVGYSPAYVRAGALLALYSSAAGVGQQAAEMVSQLLAGGALPPAQYPRDFEVAVNARVARSLNIGIASGATLQAHLLARERAP